MERILLVAVLALAAATCASGELTVTKVCQPGATWNDGCNDCRCTDTGVSLCTQRACIGRPPQLPVADECVPGTTWKQGCNGCRCTATGRAVCTQMACLTRRSVQCEPGTTWKMDCNTCWCTAQGRAACTLMGCLHLGSGVGGGPLQVANECEPGTTWKQDCNTCTCSSAGVASCTYKLCLPQPQQPQQPRLERAVAEARPGPGPGRCGQGEVWKEACNTCRCTPDGQPACTRRRCIATPGEQKAAVPVHPGSGH
ncbi:Serine protease inhibitor I/II [Frankliniella fusca]|uniref:Serine protease inhibitor I/II n=1 Tax=Frankliniella fusca TaxID=407009 RepID=A0AAE1HWM0_9NEOP|nr:Serine protease inhibitor I/II [Frankliniella fusca]